MSNLKSLVKWLTSSKNGRKALFISLLMLIPNIFVCTQRVRLIPIVLDNPANYDYLIKLISLVAIGTLIAYPMDFYKRIAKNYIRTDIEKRFEDKILTADYKLFNSYSTAKINTLADAIPRISSSSNLLVCVVDDIVEIIIVVSTIAVMNPVFIAPVVIVYLIAGVIFYHLFKRFIELDSVTHEYHKERNEERNIVIDGFNEVRCFVKEKEHAKHLYSLNHKAIENNISKSKISAGSNTVLSALNNITIIIGVLVGSIAVRRGIATASESVAVIMLATRLIRPLTQIIGDIDELSYNLSLIPEFDKFMNYENSISDGDIELKAFRKEIEFRNVCFAYQDSDKIVDNLSFCIKKGQKIGICGTSGVGKSTLLKLLLRFYDPDSGEVLIDGINTKRLTWSSLRKHIGVVSQDPYVFNGSILDNIRYAKSNATDAEILEAIKKAALYDLVKSLPDGLNTHIGPRGLKLSGGQRQRISLARVFLYDPDIILLDEATSALDNESEKAIQDAVNSLKDKTIIAIAHRLSTIKHSDAIMVIDDHKVAECGTHEQLIEKQGIYAKLYKA